MSDGQRADEGARVTRSATRVGAATMLSRVFGLARDTSFAVLFGTGFVADAFNLAFLVPNVFRRIVGEGNLNPALIPVLTEIGERRGERAAGVFLRRASGALLAVLVFLTALGVVLAEPLVRLYARDWAADAPGFAFAVDLLRILFPSLLFAGGAALAAAALNARGRFSVPALSPILLNVGFLLGALAAVPLPTLESRAIAFSIGGLAGGLAAWLAQVPAMRAIGLPVRPSWGPRDPDVLRVARLMGPGILALGVTQLNLFVDTLLALRLEEGALTALRLGNRVTLLPLGVVAVAVSTASLPSLARRAAHADRAGLLQTLAHTLRLLLTLLGPATVGLVLLARPIVELLFQYGQFTAERSTPMTAEALVFYALGLPAFGLVKGLAQAFYSVQDTKTPVKVAAVAVTVNVVLDFALVGPLGLRGLALATSIAGWTNAALLARLLRKRVGGLDAGDLARAAGRIALASTALAAGVLAAAAWSAGWPGTDLPARLARVGLGIAAGLVAMLATYRVTGHAEMREILASLPGRGRGARR